MKIENAESIPHDLWHAKQLPRLAKWEQVTFLLSAMNRTFSINEDSRTIRIQELTDNHSLTLRYRKSEQRRIEQIISRKKLTQSRSVVRGNDLFVRGPMADLKILSQNLIIDRKWKTTAKAGSRGRF